MFLLALYLLHQPSIQVPGVVSAKVLSTAEATFFYRYVNNYLSIRLTIIAVITRMVVVKDVPISRAVSIRPLLSGLRLPAWFSLSHQP
jgi:hypothetical protein